MVEFRGLPFFLVVASRAFVAQSALVHIVLAMARYTRSRRFLLGKQRCLVATDAFRQLMFAQQLEFRLCVVIELDFFPVLIRMAGFALLAVLALVLVVLAMACHAFMRYTFKVTRIDMALAAFHVHVFAAERKAGLFQTVIELCFLPAALVMAALAIGTQTALVVYRPCDDTHCRLKALRGIFSSPRGNPCTLLFPASGARPTGGNQSLCGRSASYPAPRSAHFVPCVRYGRPGIPSLQAGRGIPHVSAHPPSHPCGNPSIARSAPPCRSGRGIPCNLLQAWRVPGSLHRASARSHLPPTRHRKQTGTKSGEQRVIASGGYQYILTAMTWTMPLIASNQTKGECRICHKRNSRS